MTSPTSSSFQVNGEHCLIDLNHAALATDYNWYVHKAGTKRYLRGYLRGNRKSGLVYLHKLLLQDTMVDHINGDGLDNRMCNLRATTSSQNNANRKGVKGYWFDSALGKYRAEVWKDGKKYYAGLFDDKVEAGRAAHRKKLELFGDYTPTQNQGI